MTGLTSFIKESNRIEGILREPSKAEIEAHLALLAVSSGCFEEKTLVEFVAVIAPGKLLREKRGMDVRVGSHIAPRGGPAISDRLIEILTMAAEGSNPYLVHQNYEHLHPFMDGNGRSGRALWLWQMKTYGNYERALSLGFLHSWYYASLSNHRGPASP